MLLSLYENKKKIHSKKTYKTKHIYINTTRSLSVVLDHLQVSCISQVVLIS